jgi:hypothetical protein
VNTRRGRTAFSLAQLLLGTACAAPAPAASRRPAPGVPPATSTPSKVANKSRPVPSSGQATANPPGPRSCTRSASSATWPESGPFGATINDFRNRDPRDSAWAVKAEEYLVKAIGELSVDSPDSVRLVECRRIACIAGGINSGELASRLSAVEWAGPARHEGVLRADHCEDVLSVFWRHPRDFAGALRMQSSMAPLKCAAQVSGTEATCAFRSGGACFKDIRAACRCACDRFPASGEPECVFPAASGASIACTRSYPEFGMRWPPKRQ